LGGLLSQIGRFVDEGVFGVAAMQTSAASKALPNDIARVLAFVADVYQRGDEASRSLNDSLIQRLLVVYRDAKKQDPHVAMQFANGLITDIPGAAGSALLERTVTLGEACYGFKSVARSGNPSQIWQSASRVVHYSQECLDGLLGHLLIAWGCALGQSMDSGAIGLTFAKKVERVSAMTNGENVHFYVLLRLAKPKLRNGIAHGTAWCDQGRQSVRYTDGRLNKVEHEMSLLEFMAMVTMGCELGRSYIASLSAIVVLEDGNALARSLLPAHLQSVFGR
jgi:hypothetical protein